MSLLPSPQEGNLPLFSTLTPDLAECPLHWLVGNSRYDLQFLERVREYAQGDAYHTTLLQAAVMSQMSNRIIVSSLITRGADVNAPNGDGYTPLHVAVCSRNPDNVNRLKNNGARIDARDDLGRTPLHFAVCRTSSPLVWPFRITHCDIAIVERLLGPIPPFDLRPFRDGDGDTPLMYAVRDGSVNAVRALLGRYVDTDIPNRQNITPLHVALSYQRCMSMAARAEIAFALLQYRACIYTVDDYQNTPIDCLLDSAHGYTLVIFASHVLKRIAMLYRVTECVRSKVRRNDYLDYCLNACCDEVDLMRRLVIGGRYNLHDFVLGFLHVQMFDDPVESLFRVVVEILMVLKFNVYRKSVTRRLTRVHWFEVLKRCRGDLGWPNEVELEPGDSRRSLCKRIHKLYRDHEELRTRLQRYNYVFDES